MSILHSSSGTKTEWFDTILAWCEKNWLVPNPHGDPRRPPNAYILCRKWAGRDVARAWKKLPPAEQRFWYEIAEALNKKHKQKFPDYTFKRGPKRLDGLSRWQPGSSNSGSRPSLVPSPYNSGNAVFQEDHRNPEELSGPTVTDDCYLNPSMESYTPVDASEARPQPLTSETSWEFYNRIKASYEESWKTLNKQGRPKYPPNAFLLFKSAHGYGSREASTLWTNMTEGEKRWWDQVADYIKHDHCVNFQNNPKRESSESVQTSAQIPVYSISSVQHGDDLPSHLIGYGDGLVKETGQFTNTTKDRSTEQEPQQYQVTTIPMGSQGLVFPADHTESFPLLNSYGGTLHDSGQPWLPPSDAVPVDFTFGMFAEPPHTWASETIDADSKWCDAEWLNEIFGLAPFEVSL